jgi:hypothetical protein
MTHLIELMIEILQRIICTRHNLEDGLIQAVRQSFNRPQRLVDIIQSFVDGHLYKYISYFSELRFVHYGRRGENRLHMYYYELYTLDRNEELIRIDDQDSKISDWHETRT